MNTAAERYNVSIIYTARWYKRHFSLGDSLLTCMTDNSTYRAYDEDSLLYLSLALSRIFYYDSI